jgi:cis-L-3-hydroxyproline dehydratase
MVLTDDQKRMCAGEFGAGIQKAMTKLVEYGDAFGAERMIRVDTCHSGCYPLAFMKEILEGVEQIRVQATIHASYPGACRMSNELGLKESECRLGAEENNAGKDLCIRKGFLPIMSCAPYLLGNLAKPGDVFSWPGSSGIIMGNSIFGARGNRDAFMTTTAAAVTGFTPEMKYHLKENRRAQVVVKIEGLDLQKFTPADYGAIGYYIGGLAETKNVAFVGLPPRLDFSTLKHLMSPMPVSGAVSIAHVVGSTPEAPTLEAALQDRKPEATIIVGRKEYMKGMEALHTAKKDDIQVVLLGCPHLTIGEIREVAHLLEGKKIAGHVRLWVSTAELILAMAKEMGYVATIEKAGGLMVTDSCLMSFEYDKMVDHVDTVATNSARAGSYTARRAINIQYGSTEQCINAAITGRWRGRR